MGFKIQEVQKPYETLHKTYICSFVEKRKKHPLQKFSECLGRRKNNKLLVYMVVPKGAMYANPHSSTSLGCSALSKWGLHFPQLKIEGRLTQKDIFAHTNVEV